MTGQKEEGPPAAEESAKPSAEPEKGRAEEEGPPEAEEWAKTSAEPAPSTSADTETTLVSDPEPNISDISPGQADIEIEDTQLDVEDGEEEETEFESEEEHEYSDEFSELGALIMPGGGNNQAKGKAQKLWALTKHETASTFES